MKSAMNGRVANSHFRRPSVSMLLTAGRAHRKLMAPVERLVPCQGTAKTEGILTEAQTVCHWNDFGVHITAGAVEEVS